jgi:hypothetical protein
VNRTEYARKTNGLVYKLRLWNSRTEEYVWRAAGRDYYSHNRQKFIINVPCLGYVSPLIANRGDVSFDNPAAEEPDVEGTLDDDALIPSTYYGHFQSEMIIPLTPESILRSPSQLLAMVDVGIVRDEDHNQNDIETALATNVPLLLRRLPRVSTSHGMKHKVRIDSAIIWVWDESKPITFDEQVFRHLYGEGQPIIETLLDHPLLGAPYMWDPHVWAAGAEFPSKTGPVTGRLRAEADSGAADQENKDKSVSKCSAVLALPPFPMIQIEF